MLGKAAEPTMILVKNNLLKMKERMEEIQMVRTAVTNVKEKTCKSAKPLCMMQLGEERESEDSAEGEEEGDESDLVSS